MRHALLLTLFLSFSLGLIGQDTYFTSNQFFEEVDDLMAKYVKDGTFDYDGLSKDSKSFTEMMAKVDYADPSGWDDATQKAFYINAYNLTVIKSVLLAYPISSAEEVPGFFNEQIHTIANKKITLDALENEVIRPQCQDPRVHFALNCGAIGCPEIINKAYHPSTLDQQMDERTSIKLNDPAFVQFQNEKRTVLLSEIFDWFEGDFGGSKASTIDFINKYREDKIPSDYKIGFYPYDWTLNSVVNKNASPSDLPKKRNLGFLVSALYDKGEYELNFFNNYFAKEFKQQDVEWRQHFFSNLGQVLFGVTPRFNVGFDLQFRSVTEQPKNNAGFFEAANFRNEGNLIGENDQSAGYSRTGFSRWGPKVKYLPFKKLSNLSVQHTLYLPFPNDATLQGDETTGWLDWNDPVFWTQVFYDKTISPKFNVFAEADLLLENAGKVMRKKEEGFFQVSTPLTFILSYFPKDEIIIYGLTGYSPNWFSVVSLSDTGSLETTSTYLPFSQLGIGAKYLIGKRFQLEALVTSFNQIKEENSSAATYNFGVRYIFRK